MQIHMFNLVDPCSNMLIDLPVENLQYRPNLMMMLVKITVSYREGTVVWGFVCYLLWTCELSPCLARSVPKSLISELGILLPTLSSCSLLLCLSLCLSVSLSSGIHFFLYYHHLSLCLSALPFIMLPYLAMSSDTSPLLSVYFHSVSFYLSSFFSLLIPLSWSSFFSVLISLSPTCSSPLCVIARAAHTHACAHKRSHSRMHTVTQSHTGTPWLRLAGLFERCGVALRDCVWLCVWHVCVCTCSQECVCVCMCACMTESASRSVK